MQWERTATTKVFKSKKKGKEIKLKKRLFNQEDH